MVTNHASWLTDQKVRAIHAYVQWYRNRYGIAIGSVHGGGDELSANSEMVELLARDEFGTGYWRELAIPKNRFELYAHAYHQVVHLHSQGTPVQGWVQPDWETSPEVLEILNYVLDFRRQHCVDLNNPRDFRIDDLDPVGKIVVGDLVNTPEFSGTWQDLASPKARANTVECVRRTLHPRLEAYKTRMAVSRAAHA